MPADSRAQEPIITKGYRHPRNPEAKENKGELNVIKKSDRGG
jgi:hypothetical protein